MGEIVLARVDDRLIHGQVITKWAKGTHPDLILIIDDALAADKFMQDIYRMAAPPGIEVKVMGIESFSEALAKNEFEDRRILLLFKNIAAVKRVMDNVKILKIKALNIGEAGARPGSKVVCGSISVTEDDIKALQEIEKKYNIEVYFQMIPEYSRVSLSEVIAKYFPKMKSSSEES